MTGRRIAVLTGLLLAAAPAAADGQFFTALAPGAVSVRSSPVRITGALAVRFHGDAAAGCGARGVCGYGGTVTWIPQYGASLEVVRSGHQVRYALVLTSPGGSAPGITTADVTRAAAPGAGPCVDAVPTEAAFQLAVTHGRARFMLGRATGSLLATRCAGPRDGLVLGALPAPRLGVGALRRGRLTVSLATDRAFSGDGFAGTVSSTLALHLGRLGRAALNTGGGPPQPAQRRRELTATYRFTLGGSVVEHVQGDPAPGACAPLDACGASGTTTLSPRVARGSFRIIATEGLGRPASNLLAAFGLGRRRPAGLLRGVTINGGGATPAGGTLTARIAQGSVVCRDSAPLGPGFLAVFGSGRGVRLDYVSPSLTSSAATACPGPLGAPGQSEGNSRRIPLNRLQSRRIVLPIHGSASWTDYGYRVRAVSDLTLTLTRVRTRLTTVAASR